MSENNGTIPIEEVEALARSIPTLTTDWPTRMDMAYALLQQTAPEPEPEPKADLQLEQAPPKPRMLPPVAMTKRRGKWSMRIRKAWSFIRVVIGPRVDIETYGARQSACAECPFQYFRMRRTKAGVVHDSHCAKCGCPDWKYSRNAERNWYANWACPDRRHPGPYPDDDLWEHLKEHDYDPKSILGGGAGCTGCGCGKKA